MRHSSDIRSADLLDSRASAPQTAYSDPLLSTYWHLMATTDVAGGANVVRVWDDYRGTGVVVGVIDDGCDYTHLDLAGNYLFSFDYDARDLDADAYPNDPADRHGTTVAGVIAASLDNAVGGAGVAPEASIAGFRMGFGADGTFQQMLSAVEWMSSVDVANNSWGFDGFLGDSFLVPGFGLVGDALYAALEFGRGGLGTVVVFSAGNGRDAGQDVNYHNMQNSRGTIAVAATDSAGNVTWFSTPGAALLVAAPGQAIRTTDRVGSLGYSSGDYATMSGTSFSAPLVSGIVALMLEANPALGWRNVQEILASTAVQTGNTPSWAFNGADNWNGGAMHVSTDYGFGLVDAYAAVRLAESWLGVATLANEAVSSSGVIVLNSPIPDVGGLSSTVVLAGGVRIDHVEIDVSVLHSNIAQLQITLTSPDGTESILFDTPPTSQNDIHFTFSTTMDWGEFSDGEWTLTVLDGQAGASGTLTEWALRAYGDPVGDDTYGLYTEEFGALAAVDPARLVLSDGGGTDSINTAAIASDTLLDLRPGYASLIDGQSVIISAETLIENADTGDGNDVLVGNDAANSLRGWRGDDLLDGGAGNDALTGGAGADTLNGGSGADIMMGGAGDDRYTVNNVNDVIVEYSNEGDDLVFSSVSWTLGAHLERLYLTGSAAINGTGNALANKLYGDGNSAANVLTGGIGNDTYYAGAGDVIVEQANQGDDLVVSTIDWTLGANLERLYLSGSAAINGTGNALANKLYGDGNSAANVLAGGGGNDTYYAGVGDSVSEAPGGGTDTVLSHGDYTLDANVEYLYLNVSSAATLTGNTLGNSLRGNAGDDTLIGLAGNDTLYGGLGGDTMIGGAGDDRYDVDNVNDSVIELFDEGSDIVYSSISWTLGNNVERLYLTGSAAISATGNGLDNKLYGDGNSAANVLTGGLGNDTYYAGAGDSIVEQSNGGNDLVVSAVDWTLGANVERLYLTGSAAVNGTGNGLDNTLYGHANSAANVLTGGLGNDSYFAGVGDTIVEAAAGGTDTVYSYGNHSLSANVENLYLNVSSAATLTGNDLDNSLRGNAGADTLIGLAGNDTLDGGAGADTMSGGLGDDRYNVDNVNDSVIELPGEGSDIVYSSVSWTLGANVERLYLTGNAAINATGNELDNTLFGQANSGANVLTGGLGNDRYYVGAGDSVVEAPNAGTDTIYSQGSYSLVANVENLYLDVSSAATLTGNALANSLRGNDGDDTLIGLAGNDTFDGGPGADRLIGGEGNDVLVGATGLDAFIFDINFGDDRIVDFTVGDDVIEFSIALGFLGFSELDTDKDGVLDDGDAAVQIVGVDTVIDFGSDHLQIVGQSQLNSNDFLFV